MQTREFFKVSILMLLMSACGNSNKVVAPAGERQVNLADQHILSVLWMQRSYEVEMLRKQQYRTAAILLEENLKKLNEEEPAAIILDIDETVLDNSPYEARVIKSGLGYSDETWVGWVNEKQASLVSGVQYFLKKAESLGVEVFYISNRDNSLMEATAENLRMYNLPGADESHILLKTESSNKTERREFVKSNFHVVLVVGDQLTDFIEEKDGFQEDIAGSEMIVDSTLQYFVMLPNPMYGSFEQDIYQGKSDLSDQQKDQKRRNVLITKMKK